MKIAQICFSGLGGHSSVVFSLISADKPKEHKWSIGFIGNEPLSHHNKSQCHKYSIDYAYFILKKKSRLTSWFKLFLWLKKSKPKFVICHSISMIFPCFLYALINSAKLVSVEHTPNSQKRLIEWIFSFLSMLLSSKVVILTPKYLHEIKNSYKLLFIPSKFILVPNGIDEDLFKKNTGNQLNFNQSKEIILGMAARFSAQKKQDLLIKVLSYLNSHQSKYAFKLSLAGDGTTLKDCSLLAEQLQINSMISFKGFLAETELIDWFHEIDIYLHASDGETLSTSILQAMSCGLPIIGSDIPGISNLLHQERSFGITTKNNVQDFAESIIEIINSPKKMNEIAENARLKVVSEYSNIKMLESYISVLMK